MYLNQTGVSLHSRNASLSGKMKRAAGVHSGSNSILPFERKREISPAFCLSLQSHTRGDEKYSSFYLVICERRLLPPPFALRFLPLIFFFTAPPPRLGTRFFNISPFLFLLLCFCGT
jgi:hypothetical protein